MPLKHNNNIGGVQVTNLREQVNPSPWKPEMQVHLAVSLESVFMTVQ